MLNGGVKVTYEWLEDELKELGEALRENYKEAAEEEVADVLAWLASLANVTRINLERVTINKYNGKCPKCQQAPCQCTF
jgi:NTP pyrophosphatase (non-canonical NTP hydrolase)